MPLPTVDADLEGRLCLVTGASSGIGKAVALGLAQLGARVILACRDARRGQQALDEVAQASGSRRPSLLLVDLASRVSVRHLAGAFCERFDRLHVLVNNAGIWSARRRLSAEGVELTWATNVIGYAQLTSLLQEPLRRAGAARIVSVASELAHGLRLDDVEFKTRRYDGLAAYAQSKAANRLWTWALARRLEGTGITANAMHPGGVDTGIFRKGGGVRGALGSLWARGFGRTPEEGADTIVWLAASQAVAGVSGRFYCDRRERPCPLRHRETEERLFDLCESYFAPTSPTPS